MELNFSTPLSCHQIYWTNLGRALRKYRQALADGTDDPVVLVADLRDETARAFAEAVGLGAEAAAHLGIPYPDSRRV